jgi:hypothetical protein
MKRLMMTLILVLLASWAAAWGSAKCSIDRYTLTWTGKMTTEMGVLLYEHRCPMNHYYWLTHEQTTR